MCVALLDKNVATCGYRWGGEGGRMEIKEGWEMVVQVFLLSSYLTQGSWIRIRSAVCCIRWRRVHIPFVDVAVFCWIKRMVWCVLCSVDHGSNCEPCATTTVWFALRTTPRRHGLVRGGHALPRFDKPSRFVWETNRRGSPHCHGSCGKQTATVPQTATGHDIF